MKKIEYKSKEEWLELGKETKIVYNKLIDLFLKACDYMTQKDINSLDKSIKHFRNFKNTAENRMYQSGNIDVNDDDMLHVFFGSDVAKKNN